MASVSDLMIEILQTIFFILAEDFRTLRSYIPIDDARLVCRRWNEVILSTPLLWRTLNYTFPSKRNEFAVVRSAALPLRLCGDYSEGLSFDEATGSAGTVMRGPWSRLQPFWKIVSPEAHRWLEIDIVAPAGSDIQSLESIAAPSLEVFKWASRTSSFRGAPLNLFDGQSMPNLHSVNLDQPTPWTSPMPQNLRKLALRVLFATCTPTLAQVHTILKGCPQLEVLFFDDAGSERAAPQPLPEVCLLKLRQLSAGRCLPMLLEVVNLVTPKELKLLDILLSPAYERSSPLVQDNMLPDCVRLWHHVFDFVFTPDCRKFLIRGDTWTLEAFRNPEADVASCFARISLGEAVAFKIFDDMFMAFEARQRRNPVPIKLLLPPTRPSESRMGILLGLPGMEMSDGLDHPITSS